MDEPPERKVGYKNPPAEHRFQKGEPSPNPKGRPRKSKAFQQAVIDELNRLVSINIDGKRTKMTATQIALLQLCKKAMAGDLHAIKELNRLNELTAPLKPQPEMSEEERRFRQEASARLSAVMIEALEWKAAMNKPERPRRAPPGAEDKAGDPGGGGKL